MDRVIKEIQEKLFLLRDEKYADFQSKLIPNIASESIIGIRVPVLRDFAKTISKEDEEVFLNTLPHSYYEENLLHGILLTKIKSYDECTKRVGLFLPYIDNWAVCDTMHPAVFKKNTADLIYKTKAWIESEEIYTRRFGIGMLMTYFLDDKFDESYLELASDVKDEEDYYIKMMAAWYYATALAKQWDKTIPYITENKLSTWVNNKTIQKARESFRITDEQKVFLNQYKRKK